MEQGKRIANNDFDYFINFDENNVNPTSYAIETEDGYEEIEKSKEELEESYTERVYKALETGLYLVSYFPNVFDIDSIFKSLLEEKNYPYLVTAKYVDNLQEKEFLSNSDSAFYLKADTLISFTTGIRKEVTFKGYVKIPKWYIIKQMRISVTVLGLIWLICMGILAFLLFRKDPVVEEKKKREGLIPITDDISFDKERKCLVGQNKKARLTKQQVQFFDLILKDPEKYAYYEEMRVILWEGMVFSPDNMTQMISRTRKNIRIYPELEIRNIPGTGYQLYIRTEEEVKEFLAKKTKNEEKESA